jgi:hypothetical protein
VILKLAGEVPGFVTTGMTSPLFSVVVLDMAEIFVSAQAVPQNRLTKKQQTTFLISVLR